MVVYFHRNPQTFDIFYVGIGNIKRPYQFNLCNRNEYWHRIVNKYGPPLVQIMHKDVSSAVAKELEKHYIKIFGIANEGGMLCNMTYGGETSPMSNKEVAKKVHDKIRGKARIDMIGLKNPMNTDANREIARSTMTNKILPFKTAEHKEAQRLSAVKLFTNRNPQSNKLINFKMLEKTRRRVIQMDLSGNELYGHISINDAARFITKNVSKVYLCCTNKRKTAYGFKWGFAG